MNELTFTEVQNIILRPPVIQNWRGLENGDTVTVWAEALELTKDRSKIFFAPLQQG